VNIQGSLFNNIIFAGGIHGVGKSTICHKLGIDLNINYLSASDVLKWKEINTDIKNKKVEDIPDTQDRLITGLRNIVAPENHYILDGHFCLFNREGVVTKIPTSTFLAINPKYLIVIIGNVIEISNGLKSRDQKTYSSQSLAYMQELEVEYANEISKELNVPLFTFNKNEYDLNYKTLLSRLHEGLA